VHREENLPRITAVVLVIGQVAGVDVGTLVEQTRISPVDCPIESLVASGRIKTLQLRREVRSADA